MAHDRLPMIILADDLTGAMDVGLEAVRKGRCVEVRISQMPHEAMALPGVPDDSAGIAGDAACGRVLVMSSESRNLGEAEARERVRSILAHAPCPGIAYKKVDSTLRGNIGAELEAALTAGGYDLAVLVLSLPAAGRTVRNGMLVLNGMPVTESDLSKDPFAPVHSPYPAVVIRSQTEMPIGHVPIETVHQGMIPTFCHLMDLYGKGRRIIVADAETETDLQVLALALAKLPLRVLPCGSAGLLSAIVTPQAPCGGVDPCRRAAFIQKPWLVLSASPADATRRQIARAACHGFRVLRPSSEEIDPGSLVQSVWGSLLRGQDVVVDLAGESKEKIGLRYWQDPQGLLDAGRRIRERAGGVALGLYGRGMDPPLVLFGGDTAQAVLSGLGAEAVQLCGAVEPNVPWGVIRGGKAHGGLVVTKAGGFGTDDLLGRLKKGVWHG